MSGRRRDWMLWGSGVLAGTLLSAGVASAQVVTNGLIHACVNNGSGTIRVVAADGACGNNDIRLVWNQQGVQGAPGEPGPSGPQGPAGATGEQGPAGPSGPQGQEGTQGPTGDIGPSGPRGEAGPSGPEGAAGAAGQQGIQGPTGVSGPQGPKGDAGQAGPSGPRGEAGPAGASGPQGMAGASGPSGPRGATGATGPSGLQGPAGLGGVETVYRVADPSTASRQQLIVTCPVNKVATGGGGSIGYTPAPRGQHALLNSRPAHEARPGEPFRGYNAWEVIGEATTSANGGYGEQTNHEWQLTAWVLCASTAP